MINIKFVCLMMVVVLGIVLVSGSVFVEEIMFNKVDNVVDSIGVKFDSFMKKVDNYMGDSVVMVKVKSVLLEEKIFKSIDILVEINYGVVILIGFVMFQVEVEIVVDIVKNVEGVKFVSDKLYVKDQKL